MSIRDRLANIFRDRRTGVLIAMAGVGSAFIVALNIGFLVNHQVAPVELSALFTGGIVVLAAVLCLALSVLYVNGALRFPRRIKTESREQMMARIDAWRNEMDEYTANPDRAVTCVHLQPVERAMRHAGIEVQLQDGKSIRVKCTIDHVALYREFELDRAVKYTEPTSGNRSVYDPPGAVIVCMKDSSYIVARHVQDAPAGTPVFPTS